MILICLIYQIVMKNQKKKKTIVTSLNKNDKKMKNFDNSFWIIIFQLLKKTIMEKICLLNSALTLIET